MPKRIVKSSEARDEYRFGKHRHEHWHVDNQVYFLTARCRGRFPAFAGEDAKRIFWDRFEHYADAHGFVPWVTSLLDNHYHTIGYLREGKQLPIMMQRIHGSVAKLVNDHLRERGANPPWFKTTQAQAPAEGGLPPVSGSDSGSGSGSGSGKTGGEPPSAGAGAGAGAQPGPKGKLKLFGDRRGYEYFDGCLRSEKQGRLTYRYVLNQSRRHGVCDDPEDYPHTRVNVELERAIKRAKELDAFMCGVPYPRYQRKRP